MPDMLSGDSLRGRGVTECPPSDSRQNVGAPMSALIVGIKNRIDQIEFLKALEWIPLSSFEVGLSESC